jgi:hypothetical protein
LQKFNFTIDEFEADTKRSEAQKKIKGERAENLSRRDNNKSSEQRRKKNERIIGS